MDFPLCCQKMSKATKKDEQVQGKLQSLPNQLKILSNPFYLMKKPSSSPNFLRIHDLLLVLSPIHFYIVGM